MEYNIILYAYWGDLEVAFSDTSLTPILVKEAVEKSGYPIVLFEFTGRSVSIHKEGFLTVRDVAFQPSAPPAGHLLKNIWMSQCQFVDR